MRIASLHRYPIKGCRGEDLDAAVLDRLGVEGDRRLMLVDAEDRFLSQREVPQLAEPASVRASSAPPDSVRARLGENTPAPS